jgi:hypothetical protein
MDHEAFEGVHFAVISTFITPARRGGSLTVVALPVIQALAVALQELL